MVIRPALACAAVVSFLFAVASAAQPVRPSGVPPAAFWVGGPDGGVFAIIDPGKTPREFRAAIYDDVTGHRLYGGPLVLDGGGTLAQPGDPALYDGWDGQEMLLRDGRKLRLSHKAKGNRLPAPR